MFRIPVLAWCAALVLGALAAGSSTASAGEREWRHNVDAGYMNCAGGSTDCPTAINRYQGRKVLRGHRGWKRHHFRPHRDFSRHVYRKHRRVFRHRGPRIHLNVPIIRYSDPYYVRRYRHVAPRHRYRRSAGLSESHIQWCFDRYRSYRLWDNSFKPYHGPRKQCISPFY